MRSSTLALVVIGVILLVWIYRGRRFRVKVSPSSLRVVAENVQLYSIMFDTTSGDVIPGKYAVDSCVQNGSGWRVGVVLIRTVPDLSATTVHFFFNNTFSIPVGTMVECISVSGSTVTLAIDSGDTFSFNTKLRLQYIDQEHPYIIQLSNQSYWSPPPGITGSCYIVPAPYKGQLKAC